ncbi:MAG: RtcB family protein [Treponema sp.]|jgi:RNA-splicing ligase RtcB|nr:RtcB family protein [Treponema sp.]
MLEIKGKYNTAKVFTDNLDELSQEQILRLCDQDFTEGSKIRLMPDVHAGAGCTIGTTMTINDKIVPNLVGVDIGCGMETLVMDAKNPFAKKFDPAKLDTLVHSQIPCGMDIRDSEHVYTDKIDFSAIRCYGQIKESRARLSIGTLGGGNHFIEANRDDENNLYIVIHSGSRHLGLEVAEYYQKLAWQQLLNTDKDTDIPKDLAYVSGQLFDDYIHDMKIIQQFANLNRKAMMDIIIKGLKILDFEQFTTIHNYIDTERMILRKGAVSAQAGEKLIIPMNMRDGSIICEGLGNEDWNYSAPHGAGRLMSRNKAFENISFEDYRNSMKGIYSSCVRKQTIDESPFAYKNMKDIIANIGPTARILKIIKPVYNFKSAESKGRRKRR